MSLTVHFRSCDISSVNVVVVLFTPGWLPHSAELLCDSWRNLVAEVQNHALVIAFNELKLNRSRYSEFHESGVAGVPFLILISECLTIHGLPAMRKILYDQTLSSYCLLLKKMMPTGWLLPELSNLIAEYMSFHC